MIRARAVGQTAWLAGLLVACLIGPALAQDPPATSELDVAMRELEIAQLKLKLYENVDYALRLRHLRSEIQLVEAEVGSLQRRVRELKRHYDGKSPVAFLAIEETRLALVEAELHLRNLREEQYLRERFHADQRRLCELLLERAQQQIERRVPAGDLPAPPTERLPDQSAVHQLTQRPR